MKSASLNSNWFYRHKDSNESFIQVSLPHDAMISEKRTSESAGGINTGWFEGRDYEYKRILEIDDTLMNSHLELEFEGVYHNCRVYLNEEEVAYRPYGYTNFYVDISGKVKEGENTLRVIAMNSDQPNSRWYSGAGIYRPVRLWSAQGDYIVQNGVTIKTLDTDKKVLSLQVVTTSSGNITLYVSDDSGKIFYTQSFEAEDQATEEGLHVTTKLITLEDAQLWSPENPVMYRLTVSYEKDTYETTFGIRSLSYGKEGILINGKRFIMRGACIHHDNGIIGAVADEDAILRKVRLLKENGYNALRSAHNPCSKTFLDVCDRLGVLVMDEYIDHWYIHKTQNDYVNYFMDYYKKDIYDMVQKDKNHPCVIMYSTGNEVSETAQKRGIELTQEMTSYIHFLDNTRPVTCGVNIFFNFLSSIGFGVYSDKNAAKEAAKAAKRKTGNKKTKAVGSQFFNNMAGLFGAGFMKTGATLHGCDVKTRDAFAAMDIAGYNYGIKRYLKDLKRYPDRLILGSETFCSDAYKYYKLVQDNPRLVGDFVWAGIDYIGEVGVGAWEYKEYAPDFSHGNGWLTAGSGRLDITGRPLGEALYTKVALGQDAGPYIAVRPVHKTPQKHSPSAWKMTDARESWSWNGMGGSKATVEVYADADAVELFVNGKSVGTKKLKNDCRAIFNTTYHDGEVRAVSYDKDRKVLGEKILKTAGSETNLTVIPDGTDIKKGHLVYLDISYRDNDGIVKVTHNGKVTLQVTGAVLEGFGNGCSYNEEGYKTDTSKTYYGQCMAAIRITSDTVTVRATDGNLSTDMTLNCN